MSFGGPIDVLEFHSEDGREAGRIRAVVDAVPRPTGA